MSLALPLTAVVSAEKFALTSLALAFAPASRSFGIVTVPDSARPVVIASSVAADTMAASFEPDIPCIDPQFQVVLSQRPASQPRECLSPAGLRVTVWLESELRSQALIKHSDAATTAKPIRALHRNRVSTGCAGGWCSGIAVRMLPQLRKSASEETVTVIAIPNITVESRPRSIADLSRSHARRRPLTNIAQTPALHPPRPRRFQR